MSEWNECSEILPSSRLGEAWNYYTVCVDGIVAPATFYFATKMWRTVNHVRVTGTITHWQPLPAPLTGDGQARTEAK